MSLRPWLPVVLVLAASSLLAAAPVGKRSAVLEAALAERPGRAEAVWVYFGDRGAPGSLATGREVTARALLRRALRGRPGAVDDLPVSPGHLEEVARRVTRVRHTLGWLNAVSVEATGEQLRALEELPFVSRLDLVRRGRRRPVERPVPAPEGSPAAASARAAWGIDYGASLGQLTQINVPAVHDLGLHGEGMVVAVLDSGFDNLAHEAFSGLAIAGRRDFVNGDEDVGDGTDRGEGSHGTSTLSALAGFRPGVLVGPAFAATVLLAKTEDTESETPVEEDNWAAAAEWAEALGADVISTSLGYSGFDWPYPSYSPQDLDGQTAVSTRAAELAVDRGVVVVASAGNEGFSAEHNTLGAPSDGPRVLAVAAVDSSGNRATFSSVGPSADGRIKPDLAAQGVAVEVAASWGPSAYGYANGTSFSCPLTAGVAALVLQAHPEYTPERVAQALRSTARNAAAPDVLLGWGIVDALAAVTVLAP